MRFDFHTINIPLMILSRFFEILNNLNKALPPTSPHPHHLRSVSQLKILRVILERKQLVSIPPRSGDGRYI